MKHDYDTTLARIAGNIAAGLVTDPRYNVDGAVHDGVADLAVTLARLIVARVRDTATADTLARLETEHERVPPGSSAAKRIAIQRGARDE